MKICKIVKCITISKAGSRKSCLPFSAKFMNWYVPTISNRFYIEKHTNSEPKLTSFLNTKYTTQTKPQYSNFWGNLTAGSGYYNSGGMSAVVGGNEKFDISKPLTDFANEHNDDLQLFYNADNTGLNWGVTDYQPLFNAYDNSKKNLAKITALPQGEKKGLVGAVSDALNFNNSGGVSLNWQQPYLDTPNQTATDLAYTRDMLYLTPLAVKEGIRDFYATNAENLSKAALLSGGGTGYFPANYGDKFLAEAIAALENDELQKAKDELKKKYPYLGYGAEPMANFFLDTASQAPAAGIAAVNLPLGVTMAGIQNWGSAAQANYSATKSLKDAQFAGLMAGSLTAALEAGVPLAWKYVNSTVLPKVANNTAWAKFCDEAADAVRNADEFVKPKKGLYNTENNLNTNYITVKNHTLLPDCENLIIDHRKINDYALNLNHPVGGNKAKVFESALGYNQSNSDELIVQIYTKLPKCKAIMGKKDLYGQRYTVDIPITGPNGKTAFVRTGWIIESGSETARMTTIYVK